MNQADKQDGQPSTFEVAAEATGAADAVTLGSPAGPTAAPVALKSALAPPGYEIQGELGRGGMGVVYKARQIGLNRLVALKMVLTGAHAGPQELARFQLEAKAVASIQHPNIVQIYEVGESEGCPYLCLEFVEGGNLADKLAGMPQAPRKAACLVETLARAVHCAHLHGVIHRDLKPANILLSGEWRVESGEKADADASGFATFIPKITDFGLAKRVDDAAGVSQSGSILGTPSYMAPEQAGGKGHELCPATDVYALGAILYEVLTGRAPFKAPTPLDTVLLVLGEEPVPPSRLEPKLPRDLETICLKCLQKDPRRRYVSAEALAEDLRRFLGGEPIQARPVGWAERAVKWARRRPALAGLVGVSAAALVTLVTLALIYHARIQRSNAELATALEDRTRERERAEAHLDKAMEVVDQMLTDVGNEEWAHVPQVLELRRHLLKEARDYYLWCLQEEDQNPRVRRETARACFRTAGLHLWLGESTQAESLGKEALQLQQKLVVDFPDEPQYRYDLSRSFSYLGHAYVMDQQFDQAEDSYQHALALAEQLTQERPDVPAYQEALASSCIWSALVQSYFKPALAEARLRKAVHIGEGLVSSHPGAANYQYLLAAAYGYLGEVLVRSERYREAEDPVRKGLALLAPARSGPPPSSHNFAAARATLELDEGYIQLGYGHLPAAESSLKQGIASMEALVQKSPIFPWRMVLASTYPTLAQLYERTNRPALAEETYARSLQCAQQLVHDFPRAGYLKPILRDRRILMLVVEARHPADLAKTIAQAEALEKEQDLSPTSFYNLACLYALASKAMLADAAKSEACALKAMQLLERAEKRGFFDTPGGANLLKSDSDLQALRQRTDFLALQKRVDARTSKPNT